MGFFRAEAVEASPKMVAMADMLSIAIAEVNQRIGPDPEGDPDELLRYAKQIDERAQRLYAMARAAEHLVEEAGLIEGGFAARAKQHGRKDAAELRVQSIGARHAAALVRRDAANLRAARAEWRQQLASTLRRMESRAAEL